MSTAEHGPPASTMDTPATLRKCPASSPLNAKARQPTASVGRISPSRTWPPPLTNNEVMLYRKGGHNREKVTHPAYPLCSVLRLRLQKGGAYLQNTMVFADLPLFSGDTRILQNLPAHQHRIASHLHLVRLYECCAKRRSFMVVIQSATQSAEQVYTYVTCTIT